MSPVRRARAALPYVVCAAALVWVALSTPIGEVGRAFEHVSWWRVVAIAGPFVAAMLFADAFALWVGLRVSLRARPGFKDVVLVRGASYLLALVNYGAGQGGIVWFLHRRDGVPLARATGAVLLTTGAFLLVVVGAVAAGLALDAVPQAHSLGWLVWLVAIGLPLYLGVIVARPRWLARYALLQPLFDAGVLGTLAATAASLYPTWLRSTLDPAYSLTAANTATSPHALRVGLYWWPVGFVLAVVYFTVLFRLHRGKIQAAEEGEGY